MFRATYRLQLQKDFPLGKATQVLNYWRDLGVSHLYLSPILESRPGSKHGYDGVDPTRVSEERGGEKALDQLLKKISRTPGLEGAILDIVPNHLSAHHLNPAWWDVLKQGPASRFWTYFDVRPRGADRRIILPVLGRRRPAALAAREITLTLREDEPVFQYYEHLFPITPSSRPSLLRALQTEAAREGLPLPRLKSFRDVARILSSSSREARDLKEVLRGLPLKALEESLEKQNYILRDWRVGGREVNYRRFFDINDLAAIRVEDSAVFRWSHRKIQELLRKYPQLQGLRVDHVDGLTAPGEYLTRLRGLSPHVWVEKILGDGEKIPEQWPITGSTGYEFSNISARLFVQLAGLKHLHSHYIRHIDNRWEMFRDCVYDSKREILETHFVSEMNYLVDLLFSLAGKKASFDKELLRETLVELTSSLRVYRTYALRGEALSSRWLEEALAETEGRGKLVSKEAFLWLRDLLLAPGDWSPETYRAIKCWEQLTGPVMAKGLEDTALYRYCPLLSLNVVGGEPDWIGDGSREFHAFSQERLRTYPLGMSTTSTHDTKRSEDVRSRIHVISELSDEWLLLFEECRRLQARDRRSTLKTNVEYMIYETLIGVWPVKGRIDGAFIQRLQDYFLKAAREAKTETSWSEPNAEYEGLLHNFIAELLQGARPAQKEILQKLGVFAEKCAYFGALNSLGLLALKVLSPGLPDFYQGCELWDFSLVDPDNRRPVDYSLRSRLLQKIRHRPPSRFPAVRRSLLRQWKSGEVKLWITWELLRWRRESPELFVHGEYLALEPQGEAKANFVVFLRRHEDQWALVIIPRFLAGRQKVADSLTVSDPQLLTTQFILPPEAPESWTHILTGQSHQGRDFTAAELFRESPLALLKSP